MADVPERARRGVRIDLSDLVLEIISIVIAILLAFAVQQWQQSVKDRKLLDSSLGNIRTELISNVRLVQSEQAHHLRVMRAFDALAEHGGEREFLTFDQMTTAFRKTSPTGLHPTGGESIAWTIAQGDGSAALMDYETRARITEAYLVQSRVETSEIDFIRVFAGSTPAQGNNFFYATVAAASTLGDVVAGEIDAVRFGCLAIDTIDARIGPAPRRQGSPCPVGATEKQRIGR